ncbi:hypothetical protein DRN58_03150 [Thermococci archaeon]|nr:MAG: hypothetical protein DRN58_03150 [Thermococci archaeon]
MGLLDMVEKKTMLGAMAGFGLAVMFYIIGQGPEINIADYSRTTPLMGMIATLGFGTWLEDKRAGAMSQGVDWYFYWIVIATYSIVFLAFGNIGAVGVKSVAVWAVIGAIVILIPGHYADALIAMAWFGGFLLSGFKGDFYEIVFISENSGIWYLLLGIRDFASTFLKPLFTSLIMQLL